MKGQGRRRQFSTVLLVSFLASIAVVAAFLVFSTTPDEARAERRPPRLAAPTAAVIAAPAPAGSKYLVPALALFKVAAGGYEVHPASGGALRVQVLEQRDGAVLIAGDDLTDNLHVLLGRYDDRGLS